LILGEGPERRCLESLAATCGVERDVQLPGWIVNPYPYLMRSRLFVLSSRWEGLPTVLIEALFCGLSVVSTDCPSGPREILEGGKHGLLVPVGGTEALCAAMERALGGDAPRPSRESWAPFEEASVVGQYLGALFGA
jgi:glycosyltransferase involved in cell wall biosynthesis